MFDALTVRKRAPRGEHKKLVTDSPAHQRKDDVLWHVLPNSWRFFLLDFSLFMAACAIGYQKCRSAQPNKHMKWGLSMSTTTTTKTPRRGTLFIVSAASGTGKTSLVNALLQRTNGLFLSVSHTTRSPREHEISGVHYHFVDVPTFQRMRDDREFLESAEVFGNFYGTAKALVEERLQRGEDVLLEIDWQGALQINRLFPSARLIFILPPSLSEMKRRLTTRGTDSVEVIERRFRGSIEEIRHCQQFHYIVVNDDFETAVADLMAIVRAERHVNRTENGFDDVVAKLMSEKLPK
jgi:guanylate kinase